MPVSSLVTPPRASLAEASLHFVALLVVFVLTYVLDESTDFIVGTLVCLVVTLAYIAWNVSTVGRERDEGPTESRAARVISNGYLALGNLLMGAVLVFILGVLIIAVDFATIDPSSLASVFQGMTVFLRLWIAIMLLLGVILVLLASATLWTIGIEGWASKWRRAKNQRTVALFGRLMIALPAGVAFNGIMFAGWTSIQIIHLAQTSNLSWGHHNYSVLVQFPMIFFFLAGSALALSSHRGLVKRHADWRAKTTPADVTEVTQTRRLSVMPHAAFLVVGLAATLFATHRVIWFGYVNAMSAVPAIASVSGTADSVKSWIKASTEQGVDTEAIVTQLNEKGQWSTENPETGLLELLPDLREILAVDVDVKCTMQFTAGALSAEEQSLLAKLEGQEEELPIKFCFRTECVGTMLPDGDSKIWLWSSHTSKREGWVGGISTTILQDEIAVPGGFCTTSGDLADRYQG